MERTRPWQRRLGVSLMAYWTRHDSVDDFLESQREFEDWQRRLSEATTADREWCERFLAGATLSQRPTLTERRGKLLAMQAPASIRHGAASHPLDNEEES